MKQLSEIREPDPKCLKCNGRGVILRSNGKIPVLSDCLNNPINNIPDSEPLTRCECTTDWGAVNKNNQINKLNTSLL